MFNTISSIALLLISGGVAFMYITPKYGTIMGLRSNNSELSAALVKAKDIGNISKDLSEKMRSLSKVDLSRLELLLPEKFDELRFVNDLQGVGERNALNIKEITITETQIGVPGTPIQPTRDINEPSVGAKTMNKGYVTHKFSFTVSASYKTFIIFLKDLERSLQFADINSVSLTTSATPAPGGPASMQGGKQASQDTYTYQVEFITYSLK